MPRQPIGTTFVVAMSVLGLIAVIQILAVFVRYGDAAAKLVKERALADASTNADQLPEPSATPFRPAGPAAPAANGQQIQQLLAEADRLYRLGDFEASLKPLQQLESLAPGDPKVLWAKAAVLEKLHQPAEAVLLYEEVLRTPGLPAASRVEVKKKIDELSESLGSVPGTSKGGLSTRELPEDAGERLTDPNGIRPGATLGIIDIRSKEVKRGKKTLGVSVKSMPNVEIAGDKVKILAYFYEKTEDGEEVLTDSRIDSQWMSPPIDWADNEPEILDLEYTMPEFAGAEAGRKYLGYVVGLYYNGELQDFRADPPYLHRHFPLPFDDPQ
jgi:tetratricopeptide (TPR) repeat protein